MRSLLVWLVLALSVTSCAIVRAADAPTAKTARVLAVGERVSVKGKFTDGGFVARSIEALDDATDSLRGGLDEIDVAARRVRIGTATFELDDKSDVVDEDGAPIRLDSLRRGQVVKVSLVKDAAGVVRVDKVKRRAETSEYSRLEGVVEELLAPSRDGVRLRVLGVTVLATKDTTYEGIVSPSGVTRDDDDARGEGYRLGRWGFLNGEARLDTRSNANYDLTHLLPDDLDTAVQRVDVEWTLPSTPRVSAIVQLKLARQWILQDETHEHDSRSRIALGLTYVRLEGVMTRHGSLEIGRSRWDDERDWWFRRDIDSVRAFFEWPRIKLEAAWGQQSIDPEYDLENSRYLLLRGGFSLPRRHRVEAFALHRDALSTVGRGFQPRLYGVHAEGKGRKLWSYWFDGALGRGTDDEKDIHGHGFDAGVRLTFAASLAPTLVASYAFGTGDEATTSGVSENFRQSGLQRNTDKWNGVTKFRYYGDVFRPELSNLRIRTLGLGLLPRSDVSLDLAWHDYQLDEFASELVNVDAGDNLFLLPLSRTVGKEIDLIVAYEGLEHWEFELDLGWFSPGPAFLGRDDEATGAFLKVKYLF